MNLKSHVIILAMSLLALGCNNSQTDSQLNEASIELHKAAFSFAKADLPGGLSLSQSESLTFAEKVVAMKDGQTYLTNYKTVYAFAIVPMSEGLELARSDAMTFTDWVLGLNKDMELFTVYKEAYAFSLAPLPQGLEFVRSDAMSFAKPFLTEHDTAKSARYALTNFQGYYAFAVADYPTGLELVRSESIKFTQDMIALANPTSHEFALRKYKEAFSFATAKLPRGLELNRSDAMAFADRFLRDGLKSGPLSLDIYKRAFIFAASPMTPGKQGLALVRSDAMAFAERFLLIKSAGVYLESYMEWYQYAVDTIGMLRSEAMTFAYEKSELDQAEKIILK